MYFCTLYFWSQPAFKISSITIQRQTYILIGPSHTIIYWLDPDSLKQDLCQEFCEIIPMHLMYLRYVENLSFLSSNITFVLNMNVAISQRSKVMHRQSCDSPRDLLLMNSRWCSWMESGTCLWSWCQSWLVQLHSPFALINVFLLYTDTRTCLIHSWAT